MVKVISIVAMAVVLSACGERDLSKIGTYSCNSLERVHEIDGRFPEKIRLNNGSFVVREGIIEINYSLSGFNQGHKYTIISNSGDIIRAEEIRKIQKQDPGTKKDWIDNQSYVFTINKKTGEFTNEARYQPTDMNGKPSRGEKYTDTGRCS